MNYIYDIVLNFNTYAFDFYDWNKEDKITHIRKIPICKINTDDLEKITKNDVKFEPDFLKLIKDKTELFSNRGVKKIEYSCLLSDGSNALAIKIDKQKILKSKLQLDEEEEVLDVCAHIEEKNIGYSFKKINNPNIFMTRKQTSSIRYVNNLLYKTYKEKEYETLKYLYYECFNKKENNIKNIMDKLLIEIKNCNDIILNKIQDFYKLFSVKNNV